MTGPDLPHPGLGRSWQEARLPATVIHLDHAACSRQSRATLVAAYEHSRQESEIGGYAAEAAAGPIFDRGRAALGALVGMTGRDVAFTTSAQ